MRITTDYMIGNTAIQIVNTGKKIKIVDVEKQKTRKRFMKWLCITMVTALITFAGCFYVVRLQNTKVFLDRQVYALQGQITDLEKENSVLKRENEQEAIDYDKVFQQALVMGMNFPKQEQLHVYQSEKSTAVRLNPRQFSGK